MKNKFVDELDVDGWEVETPDGWVDIVKIFKTIEFDVWRLELEDGYFLEAADDHLVRTSYGIRHLKCLLHGMRVETETGFKKVLAVYKLPISAEAMYDLEINSKSHLYYTNGVVSHNTTTVASYLLYEAVFSEKKDIAILANKGDTATEILSRIKDMFENLPWFIKPGVREWNKRSISLTNGSKIFAAATSSSSIRGRSISLLYVDEMAFVQNDVEFYTATYPVITSGKNTKVIITSTPNGMNLFYKLWMDSAQGKNSFVSKKYLWDVHPARDEQWEQETRGNMSPQQFAVEMECAFEGSSNTLISGLKLQKLVSTEPIAFDKFYKVYDEIRLDHSYVASVDVSEGVGGDYSVISIIDVTSTPYKQVAVYRSNEVVPLVFAEIVFKVASAFNQAYCLVENNSAGKIVADYLYYDLEYENMLMTQTKRDDLMVGEGLGSVGLRQTKKTKAIGCSMLKSLIESDTLLINDWETISELSTFCRKGASWEAEPRKFDDIVMSLVLFAWFVSQPYFEDVTDANLKKEVKEKFLSIEDNSHLVFGFYNTDLEEVIL